MPRELQDRPARAAPSGFQRREDAVGPPSREKDFEIEEINIISFIQVTLC